MRIGSLFSGIGGLECGLEWSGLGHTVWQVESDPFCRRVLARHWPDAERFKDVRTVGAANLAPVDLICGGFPCTDISSAGKGAGLAGERSGLWFEFARLVGEIRPKWVIVENVSSGASRWVDAVVAGLESLDYQALPIPLSAGHVGAPYPRARVFVVAYSDHQRPPVATFNAEVARSSTHDEMASGAREVSDADSDHERQQPGWRPNRPNWKNTPVHRRHSGWAVVPALDAVVPGLPGRVDCQRALGNAVVPQCAEVIGWVVRELDAARR